MSDAPNWTGGRTSRHGWRKKNAAVWMRTETEQERAEQASRPHLDWNLRTGGYGYVVGYPAKFNFDITAANCSDDVYFTVDQAGAAVDRQRHRDHEHLRGLSRATRPDATPTVKFGIRMGTGTATSAVPASTATILYVIESRTSGGGGMILHAINVDNITANPRHLQLHDTALVERPHACRRRRSGRRRASSSSRLTFAGVTNNVASPYLDYENEPTVFRRLERRDSPGDQREPHHGVQSRELPDVVRQRRVAAVTGVRRRSGHHLERRRQGSIASTRRPRRPIPASRRRQPATGAAQASAAGCRRRSSM